MHDAVVDQVVVVDDNDERFANIGEFVHQCGHGDQLITLRTDDDRLQITHGDRMCLSDGFDQIGPEPGRIRIALLCLQPRDIFGPAGQPRGHESRLARAGRGADQEQPDVVVDTGVKDVIETPAANQLSRRPGRA